MLIDIEGSLYKTGDGILEIQHWIEHTFSDLSQNLHTGDIINVSHYSAT